MPKGRSGAAAGKSSRQARTSRKGAAQCDDLQEAKTPTTPIVAARRAEDPRVEIVMHAVPGLSEAELAALRLMLGDARFTFMTDT